MGTDATTNGIAGALDRACGCTAPGQAALVPSPAPPSKGGGGEAFAATWTFVPLPAPPSKGGRGKAGQRRPDAGRLHLICTWIKRRVDRGESWRRAAMHFEHRHRDRRLRNGVVLHVSLSSLHRYWQRWVKQPSPAAFTWRYAHPTDYTTYQELRRQFLAACLKPGTCSMEAAARMVQAQSPALVRAMSSYYRLPHPGQRRFLHDLHRRRRLARNAEKRVGARLGLIS
jgi:hypothetical protein